MIKMILKSKIRLKTICKEFNKRPLTQSVITSAFFDQDIMKYEDSQTDERNGGSSSSIFEFKLVMFDRVDKIN